MKTHQSFRTIISGFLSCLLTVTCFLFPWSMILLQCIQKEVIGQHFIKMNQEPEFSSELIQVEGFN